MAAYNVGDWRVGDAILRRRRFDTRTHSLAGTYGANPAGRMPESIREAYEAWQRLGQVEYSVSSYNTVIAYYVREAGWIIPQHTYSSTTTRHQNIVRTALRGQSVMTTVQPEPPAPPAPEYPVTDHLHRVHGLAAV